MHFAQILAKRPKTESWKTECGGQSYYYVHNMIKKNCPLECGRQSDLPEFDLLNSSCSSCGGCLHILRKKTENKQKTQKIHKQPEVVIHTHAHTRARKTHTLCCFPTTSYRKGELQVLHRPPAAAPPTPASPLESRYCYK